MGLNENNVCEGLSVTPVLDTHSQHRHHLTRLVWGNSERYLCFGSVHLTCTNIVGSSEETQSRID